MRRISKNTKQKELLSEEVKKFDYFFTAENFFKPARKKK